MHHINDAIVPSSAENITSHSHPLKMEKIYMKHDIKVTVLFICMACNPTQIVVLRSKS